MKRYFAIALAALAFAACQQAVEPHVTNGQVKVEPVITKATEVNFENGDQIGLTMAKVNGTEAYATNACLTFNENVFAGELIWYADAYSEANVYAYYPYNADGAPAVYAAVADQTAGIGQADLMAAVKNGVLPTTNAITMVFKHLMTKIVMNVDNVSGAEVTTVELKGSPVSGEVDYVNLAVTAATENADCFCAACVIDSVFQPRPPPGGSAHSVACQRLQQFCQAFRGWRSFPPAQS